MVTAKLHCKDFLQTYRKAETYKKKILATKFEVGAGGDKFVPYGII